MCVCLDELLVSDVACLSHSYRNFINLYFVACETFHKSTLYVSLIAVAWIYCIKLRIT